MALPVLSVIFFSRLAMFAWLESLIFCRIFVRDAAICKGCGYLFGIGQVYLRQFIGWSGGVLECYLGQHGLSPFSEVLHLLGDDIPH